jgi:hypothetical protein
VTGRLSALAVIWDLCWALIACLGALLGLVPDMFPELASSPPGLSSLESGYLRLSRLDLKTQSGDPVSVLAEGDAEFDAVYSILRSINPILPEIGTFESSPASGKGLIVSRQVLSYEQYGHKIPVFLPVEFELELGNVWPICTMPDLRDAINDRKVRFWSRVGLAVTVFAILMEIAGTLREVGERLWIRVRAIRLRVRLPMPRR